MSYSTVTWKFCCVQVLLKSLPSVLGTLGKDCSNIVNSTIYLTTMLFLTRVVVGGWKSRISAILIRKTATPLHCWGSLGWSVGVLWGAHC